MADGEGAAAAQGNTGNAAQQTPSESTAAAPPLMGDPKPEGGSTPPLMGDSTEAGGKPADGKPAEPAKAEGEVGDGAKPEEPIDYFADAKLPEGYQLDQELVPKAQELFGKYKLPREAAQEFIDFAMAMRTKEAQLGASLAQEQQADSIRKMQSEITSRPEFEKEKALVRLGADNLAKDNPRIRAFLNDPVFGNVPELWEILLAVGRRFETEGQLLNGGKDTGESKDFYRDLYPSMKKKQGE